MPQSSSRRSSKSGGNSAGLIDNPRSASENHRERSSISQLYDERRRSSLKSESRRGSLKPDDITLTTVPERSIADARSLSSSALSRDAHVYSRPLNGDHHRNGSVPSALSSRFYTSTVVEDESPTQGQDEDEVAGVVGAVRQYQSFHNADLAGSMPEINIAVIGAEGVGKSTFVQKAFDLPPHHPSQAVEKKLPIDGNVYLVRLLELPIEEVDIDDDDNTISWPETIENKIMPKVDGALTLYDVKDRTSLASIPDVLDAMNKAALPSVLISCKCDALPAEREVDPLAIESSARRSLGNLSTLQTSFTVPDTHKRGVLMLLRTIISENSNTLVRSPSATRRRAQSTAVRPVSPRPPSLGHARASSEYIGKKAQERRHGRHDSRRTNPYGSSDRLMVPGRSSEDLHGSFFLDESASDASFDSRRSSTSTGVRSHDLQESQSLAEKGGTLDELVDRLLALPISKADNKFAAVFLALYRKFAAPGMLLEAIVERFNALDVNENAGLMRTVHQLRYLSIMERWISEYPGDFAFPNTKRRMRTFLTKISEIKIFALAAKQINASLSLVREDDDTNWACCDKDREVTDYLRVSISSMASMLIDDPAFVIEGFSIDSTPSPTIDHSEGSSEQESMRSALLARSSSHSAVNIEAVQRQAELLQPLPRQPLTKLQWRLLMDFPEDLIAKELTKMDWVMFASIRPRDLVRQVSLSAEQRTQCRSLDHVNRMIEHFNQLAFWVANYVLLRDKPKHRALMVEKLMRVARRLRELNNYNALGAIIAGIKSAAIHRLGATRDLIPPSVGKDWLKLEILMSPTRSHFAYRLAWENSPGERIPYLPLLRRDLVSAEEGNRTFIGDESDGRINWRKFEIMGEVIIGMQRALSTPYRNLGGGSNVSQSIKELILDVKLVRDEDELFERSKQVEPTAHAPMGTSMKIKEFFKR